MNRPIQAAAEAGKQATQNLKSKLSLLQDKEPCPECATAMESTHVYDRHTAAFNEGRTPAWECPECETQTYREENNIGFNIYD